MRVKPDGPEGQTEVRRYILPNPEKATQAGEVPASVEVAVAWGIVRAAMFAGLDNAEVGLCHSRVAGVFLELEGYVRRGDTQRGEDQLDGDLNELGEDLKALEAEAGRLQEALHAARPQTAVHGAGRQRWRRR